MQKDKTLEFQVNGIETIINRQISRFREQQLNQTHNTQGDLNGNKKPSRLKNNSDPDEFTTELYQTFKEGLQSLHTKLFKNYTLKKHYQTYSMMPVLF